MHDDITNLLEKIKNSHNLEVPTKEVIYILAKIEEIEKLAREKNNGGFQSGIQKNDDS